MMGVLSIVCAHAQDGGVATGGGRYKSKLLAAKEARKLVEQDAQLLANRIALLKV